MSDTPALVPGELRDFHLVHVGPVDDFGGLPLQTQLDATPWELEPALRLGADIAAGLDRVHSLALVHGDVSPASILWNALAA